MNPRDRLKTPTFCGVFVFGVDLGFKLSSSYKNVIYARTNMKNIDIISYKSIIQIIEMYLSKPIIYQV